MSLPFLPPLSATGAATGAVGVVVLLGALVGSWSLRGLGPRLGTALGALAGVSAVTAVGVVLAAVAWLVGSPPELAAVAGVGAGVALCLALATVTYAGLGTALLLALVALLPQALLGGLGGALLDGTLVHATAAQGWAAGLLAALAVSVDVGAGLWLAHPGPGALVPPEAPRTGGPLLEDPSRPGPHAVRTLVYGSGNDRHRPEFGPGVEVRTEAVDATAFLEHWPALRRWYWGFDARQLPLNARVWLPQGRGPFPLVLLVHGNHLAEEFSDRGYDYLAELLASHGLIVVSVDQNFLNSSLLGDLGPEVPARAWLLLHHLALWRTWDEAPGHPLHRLADLSRVALVGHSRGGEAAAVAAAMNSLQHHPANANLQLPFGFGIRAVVGIAPSDGPNGPGESPAVLEDISYLTLQGTHDGDTLGGFFGRNQYRRVRFAGGDYRFKSALLLHRANHNQFHTGWSRRDAEAPSGWLLNLGALLAPEEQRQLARVYVSAFLQATLLDRSQYVSLFRGREVTAPWLPSCLVSTQFEDSTFRRASGEDAVDVRRVALAGGHQDGQHLSEWRLARSTFRVGEPEHGHSTILGWESAGAQAHYTLQLPEQLPSHWQLDADSALTLCLADLSEETGWEQPLDFTVELGCSDGVSVALPLGRFRHPRPPLPLRLFKLEGLERDILGELKEPLVETLELPLEAFLEADARFEPARVRTVRLRFDRTPRGRVRLDAVGFQRLTAPC